METIKALVIGDLILDKYIWGSASRISPEAPVPVVNIDNESFSLGGACNVANNLVSMGASATIYGAIGHDDSGAMLHDLMINKGINAKFYYSNRPTTTKTRIMAAKHQMLRIDKEYTQILESHIYEEMLDSIQASITDYHVMILSDYLKGVLSPSFTQKLIKLANSFKIPVLCDPKGQDYSKYKNATLLTPNKKEAQEATNIHIHNDKSLEDALRALKAMCNLTYPLITLSEDGIGYLKEGSLCKKPTIAKEVYDVSGAGDTVISALALKLAQGSDIESALGFANAAAAVVISKIGSVAATLDEIHSFHKIVSNYESIKDKLEGKKIVFTNGCFDILHYGHVSYLRKARALGDILIVGLNSDRSVKALKGSDRPINSQEDRAFILSSLECVSYVIIFDEDTPKNLISQILPDVLVKGADYRGKEIVGTEYAKEVKLIDFIDGKSTSSIVEKIRHS